MNKEVVKKWVDALESGEYTQGKEYLNYHQRFCCLGVLCELALKEGILLEEDKILSESGNCRYEGNGAFLPRKVQHWLGAESCDPFLGKEIRKSCSTWNDDEGLHKTFPEIAAMLREEVGLEPKVPSV